MSKKRREHGLGFLASLRKTEPRSIPIQELRAEDIIAIRTKNSKYALMVLNPKEQEVMIMKMKGKGKHCLELTSGNIVLTAAQRVSVNGVQIFPPTDETGN